MDIGVGLPSTIPGFAGSDVVTWARRAEQHGFSSLGVLDRLVYGNGDPLVTLAAAVGVTQRIRLTTAVLVAPYRTSGVLLAKQALTLDHLSGGRLVLGLSVGGRQDDFDAAGASFDRRGLRLDSMVAEMTAVWSGERREDAHRIGPAPVRDRLPLMFGGRSEAALARVARVGEGWICATPQADLFASLADQVRSLWADHRRSGRPRLVTIGYFALGPDAPAVARDYLLNYYRFLGASAEFAVSGALTSAGMIKDSVASLSASGCDELILFPCASDSRQLDMLAAALG